MLQAINLHELTKASPQKLTDFKDCISMIICKNATENCYLDTCETCPGIETLQNHISKALEESAICQVKYAL